MNTPDRAIAPGGAMVKIIHLTATGNRPWRGQRDKPSRDGWCWLILAPNGVELGTVYIGRELTDEDIARAARDLAELAAELPGLLAFTLDQLTTATGGR